MQKYLCHADGEENWPVTTLLNKTIFPTTADHNNSCAVYPRKKKPQGQGPWAGCGLFGGGGVRALCMLTNTVCLIISERGFPFQFFNLWCLQYGAMAQRTRGISHTLAEEVVHLGTRCAQWNLGHRSAWGTGEIDPQLAIAVSIYTMNVFPRSSRIFSPIKFEMTDWVSIWASVSRWDQSIENPLKRVR